jgi:hypothetical protein
MKTSINQEIKNSVEPLTKTKWSQEYPYTYEGIKEGYIPDESVAGCVAVGGAQFMKYHNHPQKGEGTIPAHGKNPEKNIDGFEYLWSLMPSSISNDSPQDEIIATSTLILDSGLAAKSNYGLGTDANHKDMVEGLVRNFGYDKNFKVLEFKEEGLGYNYKEVSELVKRNLSLGLPVMTAVPGHFVVCDGYDEDGSFYFNWGWGRSHEKNTLEAVNAHTVLLDGRPEEQEILIGDNIEADFDKLTPGSDGFVSFTVINSADIVYEGQFQIILADKYNVARSYLTTPEELILEKGEVKKITTPIKFNNGYSFGPRNIQILYSNASGIPRPLRDKVEKILSLDINVTRPVSSDISIAGDLTTPEKVAKGDDFNVIFEVQGATPGMRHFGVYFVDSNYNEYYCVGKASILIEGNHPSQVSVLCSSDNVESETYYNLLALELDDENADSSESSIILNNEGIIPASKVYIKNPAVNLGEYVELAANFDMSSIVYAESYYETHLQYLFNNAPSGIYMIRVSLTDDDGNVYSYTELPDPEVRPGVINRYFKITTPRLTETKTLKLNAVYYMYGNEEQMFYLKPANPTISNPLNINIVYRNFYDYIFLSSSLEIKAPQLKLKSGFNLDAGINMKIDRTTSDAYLVSIRAIMVDETGAEYEVGKVEKFAALKNVSTPISIECVVPEDVARGDYKVYLRATDLLMENGEPIRKIPGLNQSIVDEINLYVED